MTTVEASVVETAAADRRLQQAGLGLALRETRTSRAEGEGRGVAMHYEERDEDLDLAILVARMNDRGLRSASVFADRLTASSDVDLSGLELDLVARCFDLGDSLLMAKLAPREAWRVRFVCARRDTPFEVGLLESGELSRKVVLPQERRAGWAILGWDGAEVEQDDGGGFPTGLNTGFLCSRYLTAEFALASSNMDPDRAEALDQLRWVSDCSGSNDRLAQINHACHILLSHAEERLEDGYYAPALKPKLCLETAKNYLNAARAYDEECARIQAKMDRLENRQAQVSLLLDHQKNVAKWNRDTVRMYAEELQRKKDAVALASRRLFDYDFQLQLAAQDFVQQVKKYEQEMILKGVLKIAWGTIEIAIQIPTIVAAVSAGDIPAVAKVASIAGEGLEVAKVAIEGMKSATEKKVVVEIELEDIDDIEVRSKEQEEEKKEPDTESTKDDTRSDAEPEKEKNREKAQKKANAAIDKAMKGGKDIAAGIDAIVKAVKNAERAEKTGLAMAVAADKMAEDEGSTRIAETGIESVTGGSDAWDLFLRSFKTTFEPIAEIDGLGSAARTFQDKVEALVQYGQTLCQCRLAVAEAAQHYAVQCIRLKSENRYSKRLSDEIDSITDNASAAQSLKEGWFWGLAGIKCSLWAALWDYRASFRYWALADLAIPSIAESVPQLCSSVANLHGKKADRADAWGARVPQDFGKRGKVKIKVHFADPVALAAMREIGSASFKIAADEVNFRRMDRVRIHTIDVTLQGVDLAGLGTVDLLVVSSGIYEDRLDGKSWRFVGRPWKRLLRYTDGVAVTDSAIADEFKDTFTEPTPITEWLLVARGGDGSALDLSGLEGISLDFSGSFIQA